MSVGPALVRQIVAFPRRGPEREVVKPMKMLGDRFARGLSRLVARWPTKVESSSALPKRTLVFVFVTSAVGTALLANGLSHWESHDGGRFVCYLLVALLASGLKVQLPGIDASMSVNFLFILIGILELSLPETLVIGCASGLVQCLWNTKTAPAPIKIIFNVFGMMAPAITLSAFAYHQLAPLLRNSTPLLLITAACVYFVSNTVPVTIAICLSQSKSFSKAWSESYFWSFPYYLLGAAIAGLVSMLNRRISWQTSLLVLPIMYGIYYSYRLYLGRLMNEKRRVEETAALHLHTIEALALAIQAKDDSTQDRLHRIGVYALDVAGELGLSESETDAVRAAALLHDVGKLAVPEHILSKPGRLTPEEFEKVKIHPVVGAEILRRVDFPYPVVPIVRSHHEHWDGSGYPDGLKGEEIPIGARILSAVVCFDALLAGRQYQHPASLGEAIDQVESLAGKHFDPTVVAALKRRCRGFQALVESKPHPAYREQLAVAQAKIRSGVEPAAGFEHSKSSHAQTGFIDSIAAARQEAHTLFELSHELGASLNLDETLSLLSLRLQKLVPYDSMAIYMVQGKRLVPRYASGECSRLLLSLDIPLGQGLVGWVAQNQKAIVNGNPAVEPGYPVDCNRPRLGSGLGVPLEGLDHTLGVLALYRSEVNAFSKDDLRILQAISSRLSLSIENALNYQQAENSATTDFLTGLPNARSLFLHLNREVARSEREGTTLVVLVCDLDGFKQVNDRFGHLQGNRVLQLFAQALRDRYREYDYIARMGGDEFVIVMPNLNEDSVESKAELCDQIARRIGREVCGDEVLSASVGHASYPQDGRDVEQLLSDADRRMYLVKQEHHSATKDAGSFPSVR